VLLVGARSGVFAAERAAALLARPNVQWVGGKEYTDLPSYMRVTDVGVVPYPDNQKNRASFPLKILEYLAAGRRVVATDLPAVRWLDTDLVRVAPEESSCASAGAPSRRGTAGRAGRSGWRQLST
jgi:teichuronic acid biosynthesis glycosyltransferase TuaH